MKILKTGIGSGPGRFLALLSGTALLFSAPFAGAATYTFENLYNGTFEPAITAGSNSEDIIVNAWGDTSGAHSNVSFGVSGIAIGADITNTGSITVTAVGGSAPDAGVRAWGIGGYNYIDTPSDDASVGNVTNNGAIAVSVTAETKADDIVSAYIYVNGIGTGDVDAKNVTGDASAGNVTNSGRITVSATGGNATTDAYIYANGISTSDVTATASGAASVGNVTNSGDISLSITGGTATGASSAYAYAYAYGIHTEGTGTANSDQADTLGSITNSGAITVTAVGGIAHADSDANATADGRVMAFGLAASGNAIDADLVPEGAAYGDDSFGVVINRGNIIVDARTENTDAASSSSATANSASGASGIGNGSMAIGPVSDDGYYSDIYGADSFGTVNNSGNITVKATAAESTAAVTREDTATTVSLNAQATARATAIGIKAWSSMYGDTDAVINAEADGVDYIGTVKNSGTVTVSAVGGIATASITSADQDPQRNANANADAYAVGIMTYGGGYDTGEGINYFGAVENSGAVTVTAAADDAAARISSSGTTSGSNYAYAYADANADAYGILAESYGIMAGSFGGEIAPLIYIGDTGERGDVTNSGNITVKATAGDASAGIESVTDGDAMAYAYANANADAYAISAPGDINNSGKLTATATAGEADASADDAEATAYASAESAGITSLGSFGPKGLGTTATSTGVVVNTGAISVSATGGRATAESSTYARAHANADAYGIQTYGNITDTDTDSDGSTASVTNTGNITVSAAGGTANAVGGESADAYAYADAVAYGIQAESGIQDESLPLYEDGYSYGKVTNSGNITVSAMGGTADAESGGYARAHANAEAYGISASNSRVVNSGDIVVIAVGGSATSNMSEITEADEPDVQAVGILVETGDVINSGDITVTAEAGEGSTSSAVGIHFDGNGVLTNTGVIRASGDRAYETVVENGTVTLANYYNLTLDGDPAIGSIAVGEDAVLNLNNAKLGLAAIGGETLWNTEYTIFDTTAGGTVEGAFSGLASIANPNVTARYLDQGTPDSADDTVILNYTPQGSTFLEGVQVTQLTHRITADIAGTRQINGFLNDRLTAKLAVFSNLYADAGTWATDAVFQKAPAGGCNGFYVTPYFSDISKDDSFGYDAQTWGMVLGYDHNADGTLVGAHVGVGTTDLDYDGLGNGNSEDQNHVSAGVHALGTITGNWIWRSQVSGYYSDNDYEGLTGLNLDQRETDNYDSYGALATLMAGHVYEASCFVLLPEVGLEYQYIKTDSLHTRSSSSAFDLRADGVDEHQLTGVASLQWLARHKAGDLMITPAFKVGIRQLLTDDELSTRQSIGGSAPVVAYGGTVDRTTGTFGGTLTLGKETLSTEIGYQGELGEDTTVHSAWLQVNYRF